MSEQQALTVVAALGKGEPFHTGGNEWVVRITRPDSGVVVISEGGCALYELWDDFWRGEAVTRINW